MQVLMIYLKYEVIFACFIDLQRCLAASSLQPLTSIRCAESVLSLDSNYSNAVSKAAHACDGVTALLE